MAACAWLVRPYALAFIQMTAAPSKPCSLVGHDPEETWTLRPAWVGAGISIELVHYDRKCRRGNHLGQVEWRQIAGDRAALPKAMTLRSWLEANGATIVDPPAGDVRLPDASELARLAAATQPANRQQRRAASRR